MKAEGQSRNKTAHSGHCKICGGLKFVAFFDFAAFSIMRKKIVAKLVTNFDLHAKIRYVLIFTAL